jgi:hypothetical protein
VSEDQEQDEMGCGPVGVGHDALAAAAAAALTFDKFDNGVGPMSSVRRAAMDAMAGPGVSAMPDLIGQYPGIARPGVGAVKDLIGQYPGIAGHIDFTKQLAGMPALESVSERVSAAARSWMASADGATSGLAAAAAAALTFDKFDNGVGPMSSVRRAAMDAMAGPGDHAARFGMNWASGELGRHLHGLTGVVSAGNAMSDHLSIFDKVMGDSQRAMQEAMGRWSSMGSTAWMTEAMRGPAESIAATMRGWSTLADGGLWAARLALRMALGAKRAVMRGDIDAVKRFMCDWLDFTFEKVTPDLVNSASLVLLDEQAWLPDDVLALDDDPFKKLGKQLRKLTLAEHRSCTRLIIDPRKRAHHKSVISLDKSIAAADSDSPATLLDLVAAKPQPALADDDDDISDPRVLRVLAKLTDRERKIATERGHPGTTWAEAAVALGGTADEGFKLGRKVNRLNKTSGASAGAACRRPDPVRGSVSARAVGG